MNEIKIPFLYCNIVGAQDELVFDGSSFALDKNGNCISQCKSFEEDILYIDLESNSKKHIKYATKCEDLFNALCLGIKDYFEKTKNKEAVIGLSGGIDSAVVACLASYALGNKSVYGVGTTFGYKKNPINYHHFLSRSAIGKLHFFIVSFGYYFILKTKDIKKLRNPSLILKLMRNFQEPLESYLDWKNNNE